jgi:hypothetical protein
MVNAALFAVKASFIVVAGADLFAGSGDGRMRAAIF